MALAGGEGGGAPEAEVPTPLPGGLESLPPLESDRAYQAALQMAQQQGGSFTDPEFEPYKPGEQRKRKEVNGNAIYISGAPPSAAASSSKVDCWSRMQEMRSKLDDDAAAAQLHLRSDGLDDGWLLGAIACLYSRPELLTRIHLGVHAVRLYKDGEAKGVAAVWTTVIVDDHLPCHGKKKPIYSCNVDPGGGPAGAIGKALAKLYGCYEHLVGGRVGSALEDLTGGISDKLYLRDGIAHDADGTAKQPHINVTAEAQGDCQGRLWGRLEALVDAGHLIGAVYKPKYAVASDRPAMPLRGHRGHPLTYPVVQLKAVEGKGYVRLRNPWAKVGDAPAPEYAGDWGGASACWQNEPAVAQALGGKPRDGSFWMTFEAFVSGFNKVHLCYLPHAPSNTIVQVEGEWRAESAGGRLSAAPGSKWRSNPQYKLSVSKRCTILISISQQDSQTDANDASDSYPHAIGFHIIGGRERGGRRALSYAEGSLDSRFGNTRQVCRVLELDGSSDDCTYSLVPATFDPNVYMPYTVTIAASAPVTLEPIASKGDYHVAVLQGAWSCSASTAGGCPNYPETWTQNPQIRLTTSCGGPIGIGVLSLEKPEAELRKLQAQQHQLAAEGRDAEVLSIGVLVLPIADPETGKAPGDKPALQRRLTSAALSGAVALSKEKIIATSGFVHGVDEQATVSLDLPAGPGSYLVVPCTFTPHQECTFSLTLYHTDPTLSLTPLKGARLPPKPPSGASGNKGESKGSGKLAPPISKHDVQQVRAQVAAAERAKAAGGGVVPSASAPASSDELGDDGKMGYAQRMELEEQLKLSTWPENVPLFTVEGAPLSDNVKKEKDRLVALALDYCSRTGGKFEDSGAGGFPSAPGRAAGEHQPEVYQGGVRSGCLPQVAEWRRPEEFDGADRPVMFRNEYSVEGIIQGEGFDNRWFISALNIVSSNRGQMDRIFFGELCDEWIDKGFFVCKFYEDDPCSDDDWKVVLVDDRIPVGADGKPVFVRNPDPNVYWAMIIEKAYAKLCGRYEAMQGGTVTQGLEDLTGGIGYKFDLEKREKEWIPPKGSDPERLWNEIREKMMTEHVIGCANNTKGQDRPQSTKKGILLNRAYAIVTGGEFEQHCLMKMRIPLNTDGTATEWKGRWSDNSPTWNNRLRQMLAFSNDEDDGTFWMEYKDLCRHFNKVYMCRMLDDLWTRISVKSRWMDETAGGCTNFISWRNNNQWLLRIDRPNTKLVIKLTQPDARKSMGNGRHYSNAIGFYILKGNAPNEARDELRRKLICKSGDADADEDPGDFVFVKEPRYTRQVCVEYTFEEPSPTPYVLIPFMFEPGREQVFKLTLLSDDRDDDGLPDFGFADVKPEDDWRKTTLIDAWSRGGKGNALGDKFTAGGPVSGPGVNADGEPLWTSNIQYQLTVYARTRVFLFLEMYNVKTDMRDVEGLQTEPDYPTVGFMVFAGRGNHIKLDSEEPLKTLYTAPLKRGDGVYLELGYLDDAADRYIVIPFADKPGVEHKYAFTCYTDYDHVWERVKPRSFCPCCKNPRGLNSVLDLCERVTVLNERVLDREKRLAFGEVSLYDQVTTSTAAAKPPPPSLPPPPPPQYPPQHPPPSQPQYQPQPQPQPQPHQQPDRRGPSSLERKFAAADVDGDGKLTPQEALDYMNHHARLDTDGDGVIDLSELVNYLRPLEASVKRAEIEQLTAINELTEQRRMQLDQIAQLRQELEAIGVPAAPLDAAYASAQSSTPPPPSSKGGGSSACAVM